MAATPWETEMEPIDVSDMWQDFCVFQNHCSVLGGDEDLLWSEILMIEPSLHTDELSAPEEFAAAAATSSEARPPSLQPNNGSTSHVPRSDANYVDRNDQLRWFQLRLPNRGKRYVMAHLCEEIVTATPGVLLQSSPRVVLDPERHRSQNWSLEEKTRFLELKEAALTAVDGKDWDYISGGMMEYGFERTPKNCEDQWGTLLKSYEQDWNETKEYVQRTPLQLRIEAALELEVGRLASRLKSQAEAARKKQEVFLAHELEKLALKREKIRRLKHRHARRFQPSRRASSAKPLRPRQGRGHRSRLL